MTHFTQRNLPQDITYWPLANGVVTNDFGHADTAAPILIKGRWEAKTQQVRRADGEEVVSTTQVFVDRDVQISGYLALGDHTTGNPPPTEEAQEIQAFNTTPDLRSLGKERVVYL
jgi:hypothetical protein